MATYSTSQFPSPSTASTSSPFSWGTCEELLLASAVKKHGLHSWNLVSSELQSRAIGLNLPPSVFSPEACEAKFFALNGRYSTSCDRDGDLENTIPWLEELRKLRVAQLKRELEGYDNSIGLLLRKLRKLKAEKMDAKVAYKPFAKSSASSKPTGAEVECLDNRLEGAKDTRKPSQRNLSFLDSQFEKSDGVVPTSCTLEQPSVGVEGGKEPVILKKHCNQRDNSDLRREKDTGFDKETCNLGIEVLKEGDRDCKVDILLGNTMNTKLKIASSSAVAGTCTNSLDLSSSDLNKILLNASEEGQFGEDVLYNSSVVEIKSEFEPGSETCSKDASLDVSYSHAVKQEPSVQTNCASIICLPSAGQCNDLISKNEVVTIETPANRLDDSFSSISTSQGPANKGSEEVSCLVRTDGCYNVEPCINSLGSAVDIKNDVCTNYPKLVADDSAHNPSSTLEMNSSTDICSEPSKVENGLSDSVLPDELGSATPSSANAIDLLRLAYGSVQDTTPVSTPEDTANSDVHVAEPVTVCQKLTHSSTCMASIGESCLAADDKQEYLVQEKLGVASASIGHKLDVKEDTLMIDNMPSSPEGPENVKHSLEHAKSEFQFVDTTEEQLETQYFAVIPNSKLAEDLPENSTISHMADTSEDEIIHKDMDFKDGCKKISLEHVHNVCSSKVINAEIYEENPEVVGNGNLAPQRSLSAVEILNAGGEIDEKGKRMMADETMEQQGLQTAVKETQTYPLTGAESLDRVIEIDVKDIGIMADGTIDQQRTQTAAVAQTDCLQTSTFADETGDICMSNKEVEDFDFKHQVPACLDKKSNQSQTVKLEILEDKSWSLCSLKQVDDDKGVIKLMSNNLAPVEGNMDYSTSGREMNELKFDKQHDFDKGKKGKCEPGGKNADCIDALIVTSIDCTKCEADANLVLECNLESQLNLLADCGGTFEPQRKQKVLSEGNDSCFGNKTGETEPDDVESRGSIKGEVGMAEHLEHDKHHFVGHGDELSPKLQDKCKETGVKTACFAEKSRTKMQEESDDVDSNKIQQVPCIEQEPERVVSIAALSTCFAEGSIEKMGEEVNNVEQEPERVVSIAALPSTCFSEGSIAKVEEEINNVDQNTTQQVPCNEQAISMQTLPSMLKNLKQEMEGSSAPQEEVNETNPHETYLFPTLRTERTQTTGRLKANRSVRGKGMNLTQQRLALKNDITILNLTAGMSDIASKEPFVSEVVTRRRTRSRQLPGSMSIGKNKVVSSNNDMDENPFDSKVKLLSRGQETRGLQQQENFKTSNEVVEEELPEARDNDSQLEKSEVGSVADGTDDTSPISKRRRRESKVPGKLIPFLQCLRRLSAHKFAPLFKQKQESQINPRYDLLIRRHVDLSIVRSRLEEGSYSGSLEFFRDLLLIFNNALVFYSRDSHEYGAALALRECVMKEMEKIFQTEALLQNSGPATRKREPRKRSELFKSASVAVDPDTKRRVSLKSCNNDLSVCESNLDQVTTIKGRHSGPESLTGSKYGKGENLRDRKSEGNGKVVMKGSTVSVKGKYKHEDDRINSSQEKNARSLEDIDAIDMDKNDLDGSRANASQTPEKANEETLCAEFGIKPSKLTFLRQAMTAQGPSRKRVGRPRNPVATGNRSTQKRAKM